MKVENIEKGCLLELGAAFFDWLWNSYGLLKKMKLLSLAVLKHSHKIARRFFDNANFYIIRYCYRCDESLLTDSAAR